MGLTNARLLRYLTASMGVLAVTSCGSDGGEVDSAGSGSFTSGGGLEGHANDGGDSATTGSGGIISTGSGGDVRGSGGAPPGGVESSGGSESEHSGGTGGDMGTGGEPPLPICTPGDAECQGDILSTCADDGLSFEEEECPFACENGACTGACSPGTTQCSGHEFQSCGVDATWVTVEEGVDCPCLEGETRCWPRESLRFTHQTCDENGDWASSMECEHGCDPDGCFGECLGNAGRCQVDGITPEVCEDYYYVEKDPCEFVCSGFGSCAGECVPGTTSCMNDRERGQCVDGYYEPLEYCGAWCENDTCMSCKPGGRTCTVEGEELLACSEMGEWEHEDDCEFSCIMNNTQQGLDASCGGVCEPGTFSCGEGTDFCDDGSWRTGGPCNYGCSTVSGCECEAPEGRLVDLGGGAILDTSTGLVWRGTWATHCSQITAGDYRNATFDEIQTLLAQQARTSGFGEWNTSCAENTDPLLVTFRGKFLRFAANDDFPEGGVVEVDTAKVHRAPYPIPPDFVYACVEE